MFFSNKKNNNNNRFDWGGNTYLRYAPALGNFANVLTDAFGITNKEDYSNADLIRQSVKNLSNVTYNPISNYLSYRPFDRNYYSNKLSNQAAATRRAIVENSGLNRAAATAGHHDDTVLCRCIATMALDMDRFAGYNQQIVREGRKY